MTGLGFKVLLMDDLVKDFATAHSESERAALWNHWVFNVRTRVEPPALTVLIGTRWHDDDIIARALSSEYDGDPAEWEVISFPAIAEDHDILGRIPGEPLVSPQLNETPDEALARWQSIRESVGSYAWSALYQQSPSPAKGAIFDIDSIRFWTRDPQRITDDEKVVLLPADQDLANGQWLDSWDMAFKGTATSDYVVGQRWVRVGPTRYLIAQQRARLSFTQSLTAMRQWARTDDDALSPYGQNVHLRLVEDAANGTAIIETLKKQISGIKPIRPDKSKEARARAITPEVESGHVRLPHPLDPGNDWVTEFLAELREFPNAKNDDQVDSLTQALSQLRQDSRSMITVPRGSISGRSPRPMNGRVRL